MNRTHHRLLLPILLIAIAVAGCGASGGESSAAPANAGAGGKAEPGVRAPAEGEAVATFAGGCFWCMEPPFEKLEGVNAVISGYMGGPEKDPTYENVSYGRTGHTESVQILYDPKKITYQRLLEVYWHNVDPTTADRQFCDRGQQYRPEIFWQDSTQRSLAEASLAHVNATKTFEEPVVVKITRATPFYPAEGYHQDFYKKNPARYYSYRAGCGRDARLKKLWGELAGH
jgi:peptide-methionine (S)-S-oxide reductase